MVKLFKEETQAGITFPMPLTEKYRPQDIGGFVGLSKPKTIFRALLALALAAAPAFGRPRDQAFLTPAPRATKRRIIDKKFLALATVAAGSSIADSAQTLHCLSHVPGCRETDPIYGPHPSAGRLVGTSLAIDAAYTLASYELRKHGPRKLRKFWALLMTYVIYGHSIAMAQSERGGK